MTSSDPALDGLILPEPVHEEIRWSRVFLSCGVILGGALALAILMVALKPRPERRDMTPPPTGVDVYEVRPRELRPELTGLGRSRPRRRVAISARVGGEVVATHNALRDGNYLDGGVLALTIDPADYQQAVARSAALLDAAEAEEARLRAQVAPLASRLDVGRRQLALERDGLARVQRLLGDGVGTDRDLDVARATALRAEDALISLRLAWTQLGPQTDAAAARVRDAEASLASAQLDLDRTRVVTPFAGQLAQVMVEVGERVSPGSSLFELWETEVVEVPVVLTLDEAALLAPDLRRVVLGETDDAPKAEVRFEGSGAVATWEGLLRRFEPVDAQTQTVKAVVEVRNHDRELQLPPNVFCRVLLEAEPIPTTTAIPLAALQERDRVYVVGPDETLAVAPVEVGRRIGRWVEVTGLPPGTQVIVSGLEEPIEGLPLVVNSTLEME